MPDLGLPFIPALSQHSSPLDTLWTSFSLGDQGPCKELLPMARKRGMDVIIKRPIANAVWGAGLGTGPQAHRETAARLAEMGPVPGAPEDAIAVALGFTPAHEEVDTTIVGTRNPEPMVSNIALVEHVLPLAEAVVEELHRRFERAVKR